MGDRAKYFKYIEYNGNPIKIGISFYDGDNLCKTETYELNEDTINNHYNNGFLIENI